MLEIQKPGGFWCIFGSCTKFNFSSTQESRRGVERAAPQKAHPIKHKKIPAQTMQGFFIYPSLSKQLGPDLWHQRVFTHRYIVTKIFCLFSVP